jgi:hypothetical protein
VASINLRSKSKFKHMENVTAFLKGCRSLGVGRNECFDTLDIFEGKNTGLVLVCLYALAGAVQTTCPEFDGPYWGNPTYKPHVLSSPTQSHQNTVTCDTTKPTKPADAIPMRNLVKPSGNLCTSYKIDIRGAHNTCTCGWAREDHANEQQRSGYFDADWQKKQDEQKEAKTAEREVRKAARLEAKLVAEKNAARAKLVAEKNAAREAAEKEELTRLAVIRASSGGAQALAAAVAGRAAAAAAASRRSARQQIKAAKQCARAQLKQAALSARRVKEAARKHAKNMEEAKRKRAVEYGRECDELELMKREEHRQLSMLQRQKLRTGIDLRNQQDVTWSVSQSLEILHRINSRFDALHSDRTSTIDATQQTMDPTAVQATAEATRLIQRRDASYRPFNPRTMKCLLLQPRSQGGTDEDAGVDRAACDLYYCSVAIKLLARTHTTLDCSGGATDCDCECQWCGEVFSSGDRRSTAPMKGAAPKVPSAKQLWAHAMGCRKEATTAMQRALYELPMQISSSPYPTTPPSSSTTQLSPPNNHLTTNNRATTQATTAMQRALYELPMQRASTPSHPTSSPPLSPSPLYELPMQNEKESRKGGHPRQDMQHVDRNDAVGGTELEEEVTGAAIDATVCQLPQHVRDEEHDEEHEVQLRERAEAAKILAVANPAEDCESGDDAGDADDADRRSQQLSRCGWLCTPPPSDDEDDDEHQGGQRVHGGKTSNRASTTSDGDYLTGVLLDACLDSSDETGDESDDLPALDCIRN